jgi:hypothetical protein
MELEQPKLEKDVIEYDFIFQGGSKLPITLDTGAGDTVTEEPERFVLYLAAKPSPTDDEVLMPAETAYVYKSNLVAFIVRNRKMRLPTPEEKFQFKKTLHSLVKGIQ